MGCWNGTCGVTNTPIIAGKKVECILILNNKDMPAASGISYITGYAKPLSFTFEGIYDDYGSVTHIPENQLSISLIMDFFENEIKENSVLFKNEEFVFDKNNFIDLLKNIERENVFLTSNTSGYSNNEKQVGLMMFHNETLKNLRETLLTTDLNIYMRY